MIHIEQNQTVAESPHLKVFSVTGDYSDADLIECYDIKNPNEVSTAFQAQFVKYGALVYRYSELEELGKALVEFDSSSTHDAALLYKEDEERRIKRSQGKLEPTNPVPVDENLSQVAQDIAAQDTLIENIENSEIPPVSSPEVVPASETPVAPVATSTTDMSTTTPILQSNPVVDSDFFTSSSSTPVDSIIPPAEEIIQVTPFVDNVITPTDELLDVASSTVPVNP